MLKTLSYEIFVHPHYLQILATHQKYENLVEMEQSTLMLWHLHPMDFELQLSFLKMNILDLQKTPQVLRLQYMNQLMTHSSIQQMHLDNLRIFLAYPLILKNVEGRILNLLQ